MIPDTQEERAMTPQLWERIVYTMSEDPMMPVEVAVQRALHERCSAGNPLCKTCKVEADWLPPKERRS